jgi:hypothetical protein
MPRGNAGYIGAKQTPNTAGTNAFGVFKMSEVQQLLSASLFGTGNVSTLVVQVFTATSQWIAPTGTNNVTVLVVGGGAGGF